MPARRFWNFFEFSSKEQIYRESRKCPAVKDVVSSVSASNETEDASKTSAYLPPMPGITSFPPKIHTHQFNLKTPMNYSKVQKPFKEDNLMSLLDGNPVPKTLKWKLKGYKTLRNEQAGDFAFVPGGNTYDFDILSRSDCLESTCATLKPSSREKDDSKIVEEDGNSNKKDALPLGTKAIETAKVQPTTRQDNLKVSAESMRINAAESTKMNTTEFINLNEAKMAKLEAQKSHSIQSTLLADKPATAPGQTAISSAQAIATPISIKEDIEYLPLSKLELPTAQMKHRSQPSAQYCSQPPKPISKPLPPVLHQPTEKLAPSIELDGHQTPLLTCSVDPQPEAPVPIKPPEEASQKWSPMEQQSVPQEAVGPMEEAVDRDAVRSSSNVERKSIKQKMEQKEVQDVDSSDTQFSSKIYQEEAPPSSQFFPTTQSPKSPEYFAPKPWKQPGSTRQAPRFENRFDTLSSAYESIGVPIRSVSLKISSLKAQRTSPCAATEFRLQQSGGNSQSQPTGSFGSSVSGSSSGGSRKPPSPPFPTLDTGRSSTDSTSPLSKLPSRGVQKGSRSNISTASANQSPKKCKDGDDMIEGKVICTKPRQNKRCKQQRSCEREERPTCQRQSKIKQSCQRYCCPALQMPTDCDYDNFSCPKPGQKSKDKHAKEKERDPTCLPEKSEENSCQRSCSEGGRQMCTDPSKRRSDSCRRQTCERDRSERSCTRERDSCRPRERSCKGQEQRECSQRTEGREICTKPRKRESSCSRRRKEDQSCGRSSKCPGRRNYTNSAFVKRPKPSRNIKRYSSMPALDTSVFGTNVQGIESKRSSFNVPLKGRFYGKKSKPPPCKPSKASSCKSSQSSKCKNMEDPPACKSSDTDRKCKKGPPKCMDRKSSESKCKPRKTQSKCKPRQTENKCKPRKSKSKSSSTCGKSSSKKDSTCKASSEDICTKRREQFCRDKKASDKKTSEGESPMDRTERELKEIQNCKNTKDRSKESKKSAAPKGLERVISPCKQRQRTKKTKDGCSKFSSGLTLNRFINTEPLIRQESVLFGSLIDRSYSTVKLSRSNEFDPKDSILNQWKDFWKFTADDDYGLEDDLPLPIAVEIPEEQSKNNPREENWFSWFNP